MNELLILLETINTVILIVILYRFRAQSIEQHFELLAEIQKLKEGK